MYLADPSSVRQALGFDNMPDITSATENAVASGTTVIEARLLSTFKKGSHTDIFFVPEPRMKVGNLCLTRLMLKTGFVIAPGTVSYAINFTDFADAKDVTLDNIEWDLQKGVISSYTQDLTQQFVKVTYDAGFDPDGTNADLYDQSKVPDFLKEAVKLHANITLETHPALENAGVKQDTKRLVRELEIIMARNTRYDPMALLPI